MTATASANTADTLPHLPGGTVTFLFTDIQGSTRLLEQLREQYALVLADQRDLLRAAFTTHHGTEIDTQGDSFFVAFPRALDAVACVADCQRALAAHAWPQGAQVRVRMGLHTGEPILARTGYVGMDVNRAARIAAAGHGGQVLLSQTTRDLVWQDLPAGLALRGLGEHKLKDIRYPQPIFQLEIEGLPADFPALKTAESEAPPTPGEAPFKGLQYFGEEDANLFFGREALTAGLVQAVCDGRFLAVVGASGSGKSSLVRAGLVPALRRGGRLRGASESLCPDVTWQVFVLTPTAHPLEALATNLMRGAGSAAGMAALADDLRRDARSLHFHVNERLRLDQGGSRGAERLLVVVDQFEETFTLCRDEGERIAFIDNLLHAAAADGGGTSVLLTLRADFYGHLAPYPELSQAVAHRQEYIGAMNAEELRQAIEAPAAAGGWEFSPGLVDLLLYDIGAGDGRQPEPGALPLLSHALLETWQHRRGVLMNLRAYAESGGVRGAIARTAEGVYQRELSREQQAIARAIFLRLTELGEGTQDTRRRAAYHELFPPAPGASAEQIKAVIARLADARLITTDEHSVEVAHEALIREWPTLREWLSADREGLRLHRHLTEAAVEWARLGRDPGDVYHGARLAQALEWAAVHAGELNALEHDFLAASQAEAERQAAERDAQRQRELEAAQRLADEQARSAHRLRQRNRLLTGLGVAALLLALLAGVFGQQANQSLGHAQAANTQAAAQQATAEAEAMRADQQRDTALSAQATAQAETVRADTEREAAVAAEAAAQAEREAADRERRLAVSRVLAVAATNNLEVDAERSVLLALEALASADTREAQEAMHQALMAHRAVFTLAEMEWPSVAYSPDGTRLALAQLLRQDDQVTSVVSVWAVEAGRTAGQPVLTFSVPEPAGRITYSPDGTRLAMNLDSGAGAWDALTGDQLLLLSVEDESFVQSLAFSPDGARLATGWGRGGTVVVWDVETGEALLTIREHTDIVESLSFNADGTWLATGGWDGLAAVWDSRTGQALRRLSFPTAVGATFTPDGTRLVVGTGTPAPGLLTVLDTATWQPVSTADLGFVYGVKFIEQGGRLRAVAGSQTGRVTLLDVETSAEVLSLGAHRGNVGAVSPHPDGVHLATTGADGTAKIWDISPEGRGEALTLRGLHGIWPRVQYSPDGTRLAVQGPGNTVLLRDANTGEVLLTLDGHTDWVQGIAFSPDGALLATAGRDLTVRLWDTASGELVRTMSQPGHGAGDFGGVNRGIMNVVFSPDGTRLATAGPEGPAGADGSAIVWDAATGEALLTVRHTSGATNANFNHDGTRLATTHDDGTFVIWDAATGEQLMALALVGRAWGPAFSPDGRHMITLAGFAGPTVRDTATGEELFRLIGHSGGVVSAAYSRDGSVIATSGQDSTARLWDAATGQPLLELTGPRGGIGSLAFSPDGSRLATASRDGLARVFLLRTDELVALARSRLTRTLTTQECRQFLHLEACPAP
jgi:WD40 repeat protein/class 3 adenylate cyclase